MKLRGWNQSELASRSGLSQKTISNVVNSRNDVQLDVVDSIAAAFGLSMWHVIMPALTDELLNSTEIEKLFSGYLLATTEGRELIDVLVRRESMRDLGLQ